MIRNDRGSHIISWFTLSLLGQLWVPITTNFAKSFGMDAVTDSTQYYGYSSQGSQSVAYYDVDWMDHEYFVSTSEAAIEMNMLKKFDYELLLGQISYNQKAEIYNYSNGYPVHPKKCSTLKQHEMPEPRLVQK